jgi:uncharacterized membrane protein
MRHSGSEQLEPVSGKLCLKATGHQKEKHMSTIEQSIDVDVPVRTAYNQWARFEEFPHFMERVKEITRLDDIRLRWKADIGGREREWEAKIIEQTPDQRIAWSNQGGRAGS